MSEAEASKTARFDLIPGGTTLGSKRKIIKPTQQAHVIYPLLWKLTFPLQQKPTVKPTLVWEIKCLENVYNNKKLSYTDLQLSNRDVSQILII